MFRYVSFAGIALLVLLLVGGALALLAYGPEPTREGTLTIDGLEAEVQITWADESMPLIESDSEAGLWTGLGYAHAADHAWAIGLWRQAALGGLSSWIGSEAADLDRHARQLAFADVAQEAYHALSDEDRAAVDAYARGVAQALADPAVAERDELIRLGVELDPWEPWHALAIERLLAWISTGPLATDSSGVLMTPEAVDFARADSAFRSTLALGGFEHGRAFVAPTTEGPTLVAHQPYGASALPLLTGAQIQYGGRSRTLASVPGTLMLASGGGAWSILLTSDARLVRDPGPPPPPAYSRIADRDGNEVLTEVLRDARGLRLQAADSSDADTLAVTAAGQPVLSSTGGGIRLLWTGYSPIADVGAWRALLRGTAPTFRLWRGDGILVEGTSASILGAPSVVSSGERWTFVGGHPTSRLATRRFQTLADLPTLPTPGALAIDTGSPWGVAQVRPLLAGLGNRDALGRDLQDAYAFLRGWDGLYIPDAVAPTISEAWIDAHRRVFERSPDPRQRLDSLLLRQTLRLGLATLRDSLGSAPGLWTWERWNGPLRYPLASGGRFQPLASRAGGHPSALLPSPSLVLDGPPGPAVFTMWTTNGQTTTSRPSVGRGAPRDGRDPIRRRSWRTPGADAPTLRLLPPSR